MISLKSNQQEREIVPFGNHLGRLYSIVELGNLPIYNKPGETGRKVMFTWELPEEMRDFNGEEKPLVISFDYFISMYKTSQLRKAVEGIVGKLDDSDAEEFNLQGLLGKSCMVNVVHTASKANGRMYANVGSITPLPKAVKEVPPQINPSTFFSYGEFDNDVYNKLPAWVQRKMSESTEMKEKNGAAKSDDFSYPSDEPSDGIPF